jgi:hypothetical protein
MKISDVVLWSLQWTYVHRTLRINWVDSQGFRQWCITNLPRTLISWATVILSASTLLQEVSQSVRSSDYSRSRKDFFILRKYAKITYQTYQLSWYFAKLELVLASPGLIENWTVFLQSGCLFVSLSVCQHTSWIMVLEKATIAELVKKFHMFCKLDTSLQPDTFTATSLFGA